jgi:acyl-CoA thioesterase-1
VTKDSIINNAKGGYTTFHFLPETIPNKWSIVTDVKRNITASLKLNPDLVIFSITTNDIAMGFTADQYMANMKVMTDLCEANHVLFLIGSTTPRLLDSKGINALIEINNRLKTRYNDKFVDYYQKLTNLETFKFKSIYDSGDSLHPNNEGHKVIFDAFHPVYLKIKNKIFVN